MTPSLHSISSVLQTPEEHYILEPGREGGGRSLPQLRLVNVVTMMQQKRTSIQAISRTYLRRGVIRQVNYRDDPTHMRKMKVAVATLPLTLPT